MIKKGLFFLVLLLLGIGLSYGLKSQLLSSSSFLLVFQIIAVMLFGGVLFFNKILIFNQNKIAAYVFFTLSNFVFAIASAYYFLSLQSYLGCIPLGFLILSLYRLFVFEKRRAV